MGLTLLEPLVDRSGLFAPITDILPGVYTLPNRLEDPEGYAATIAQIEADAANLAATKYDWLLSHSLSEVTASGYFVGIDDGSIFTWLNPEHTSSTVYLALQDIQNIENARGTAGALLLHLQEPALAKDTAGYAGGGSSTWGSTQYTDPISEIQDLPPVTANEDGEPVFEYTGPSTLTPTDTSTTPTIPSTTTTTATIKSNIAPLAAIAAVLAVAVAGDQVIGRRTNMLFVGGVGALFYIMAKRNK